MHKSRVLAICAIHCFYSHGMYHASAAAQINVKSQRKLRDVYRAIELVGSLYFIKSP